MSIEEAVKDLIEEVLSSDKGLEDAVDECINQNGKLEELVGNVGDHEDRMTALERDWECQEDQAEQIEQLISLTETMTQHIMDLQDALEGTFWKRTKRKLISFKNWYCNNAVTNYLRRQHEH